MIFFQMSSFVALVLLVLLYILKFKKNMILQG